MKPLKYLLIPLHKLHVKGGAVHVDGMRTCNTREKSITKKLGNIFFHNMCRKGCQVELYGDPSIDGEISVLMLEGLEILNHIALLKDGTRKMIDAECDSHVALDYQSWARLQIQSLYKHLDEIKETEQEAI